MPRIKNPKSNTRRTDEHARAKQITAICDRYVRGRSQAAIAAELGVSQSTVRRAVAALEAEWREHRLEEIDAWKRRELAALRAIEAEAWSEWERSKRAQTETHAERSEDTGRVDRHGAPLPTRVRERSARTEKEQIGDPRLLAALLEVREKIAKLLGLNAPTAIRPELPPGVGAGTGVLMVGAILAPGEWERNAKAQQATLPGAT